MFGGAIPGTDPAEVVKQVAAKLKEEADKAGISSADAFVDKLEGLKEKAKEGPHDMLNAITGAVEGFKQTIEDAMSDPGSLATGPVASCASWYGNAVVSKLKKFMSEVEDIFNAIKDFAEKLKEPFQEAAKVMGEAMAALAKTIKGLTGLPNQVEELSGKVKGPDDLKDVDTDTMKTSLDVSAMDGALGSLGGLKSHFAPLIELIDTCIKKLVNFVEGAADQVKNAFSVPSPCCCLTSAVTPEAMKTMLSSLDALRAIDFNPMTEMVKGMAETLGSLDVDAIKKPLSQFADSAKESVESLDVAVKGAKMTNGLPGF